MWPFPLNIGPSRRRSSVVQRSCDWWKIGIFPQAACLQTVGSHGCVTAAVWTTGSYRLVCDGASQTHSGVMNCGLPTGVRALDPRCPSADVRSASWWLIPAMLRIMLDVVENVADVSLKSLEWTAELQRMKTITRVKLNKQTNTNEYLDKGISLHIQLYKIRYLLRLPASGIQCSTIIVL